MGKAQHEEKQRRKAAQRAAAEKNARRRGLIRNAAAIALIAIVAAVAYSQYTSRQLLNDVRTTSYPAGLHVAGSVLYAENPPMGGQHNVVWQSCGIYDAPIHNEHAVHSLEHGAVWITYRPDLPSDQVQMLETLAADDYMLLSPYPGLPHPIVASAWNRQLSFERADEPALPAFIARFKNNPETTPEFGAACSGGTRALASATDSLTNTPGPMAR